MSPNLIGLVGKAGVGKDTIAAELVKSHGYTRVAFADALKASAYAADPLVYPSGGLMRLANLVDMIGWDEAKRHDDVRRFLQRHGVAMRDQIPGCWVAIAASRIVKHLNAGQHVVVTDVRFPDEAETLRDDYDGHIVRINRHTAHELGDNAGHVSEQGQASIRVDMVVDNSDGLDSVPRIAADLHAAVSQLNSTTIGVPA